MNENSIKWISCYGMDLSPINLSVAERLDKFSFALVLDEFGSGKVAKAQLCIRKELERNTQNILIICPPKLMQYWYKSLLTELGVDFKFISGSDKALIFFSQSMSNLYIMSDEELALEKKGSVIEEIRQAGIVWDLMIIDAAFSMEGIDPSYYVNGMKTKANKLLVFSPVPSYYDGDPQKITDIPKGLLADPEKAKFADSVRIDEGITAFSMNTPALKYFDDKVERKVTLLEYEMDDEMLVPSKRIDDLKTGIPRYPYGGNVFEEYSIDERKLYLRNAYTKDQVNELCGVDRKLKLFLEKLAEISSDPSYCAVCYCVDKNTVNYLVKVINALYSDRPNFLQVITGNIGDNFYLRRCFGSGEVVQPSLLIATDDAGEKIIEARKITHIFNYELPENPSLLERRYLRSGRHKNTSPEFFLFTDKSRRFDGRMLTKVVTGNIYKAFRKGIPSRNILFSAPNYSKIIMASLKDIKFVKDYTGEVGSSFDVISKFRSEYNVPAERNLTTAQKTHEYTEFKLSLLTKAFGVSDIMSEKEVNNNELLNALNAKVESFKNGLVYFNDDMELVSLSIRQLYNEEYENYCSAIVRNECVDGLKRALTDLNYLIGNNGDYVYLKDKLEDIPDPLTPAVVYNIWRYCKNDKGIKKPYQEFISKYNEGVI